MRRVVALRVALGLMFVLLAGGSALFSGLFFGGPVAVEDEAKPAYAAREGDEELAYLLVKLELRTRQVIAGHYGRRQSAIPGVDTSYKRLMAKNGILPAAVAGRIFADVVPGATGGRAWVRMVVPEPRNPKNKGDAVALELVGELQAGAGSTQRRAGGAYYYAEPIKTTAGCLPCHGEPKGGPDPVFPQYKKDGWKPDMVIGAVVARVAAKK